METLLVYSMDMITVATYVVLRMPLRIIPSFAKARKMFRTRSE
jgi:hypothetical protein